MNATSFLAGLDVRKGRAGWFARTLALVLVLVVQAAARPLDLAPPTAHELRQGYRDDLVIAMPHASLAGTVSAQEYNEGVNVRRKFSRLGGLRVIAVNAGETPDEAIRRLKASGRYRFVEPDYLRTAYAVPNDADFTSQWALDNTGTNTNVPGPAIVGADIHATSAWDIRTDASSVIVAVVDSGARLTHQDLASNLWVNPSVNTDGYTNDLHGINTVSTTSRGDPTDDNGHGTHVSGIIGAVGNNAIGVTGVAWKVQLMELKFLDSTGSGDVSNAITCIDYAVAHGASIINCSYGGKQFSQAEFTAIQAAAKAGVIIVCSAGNEPVDNDLTPSFPADYPSDNVVAVAASDNRDDLTYFSDYGSGAVELAAPGNEILSLSDSSDTGTTWMSGTSMAAPMVSGSLALLKAQFPKDTYRELINRLLSTVDSRPQFAGRILAGGRLNLAAALASTSNRPFNDNFASRAHLTGQVVMRTSNADATRETGEPLIRGNAGGASLWWDWTAPISGTVTLSTGESTYASLLAVYTGSSLSSLTPVASAESTTASTDNSLTFQAVAGTTYDIALDGVNGATGFAEIGLGYGNDAFADATVLSGPSVNFADSNAGTTSETGEPQAASASVKQTVWYAWTAPSSGPVSVSATSYDFDPALAVYTGSSLTALTRVSAATGATIDSNAGTAISRATVSFNAVAGTIYRIQVDGINDTTTSASSGAFALSIADSLWQYGTGDSITSSPAVGAGGVIYVGSDDSNFYAFNSDGSLRWKFKAGGYFDTISPAIASDGTIYAPCSDGKVYAFNPDGSIKWTDSVPTPSSSSLSNELVSSPAIASDGTVYVKAGNDHLYALNPDGSQKWTATVPGFSYASPTVAPDGSIYIGADNGTFYALKPDGSTKWTFTADSAILTSAAIDASGNLYFGTLGGTVYSLAPDGSKRWSIAAGDSVSSSPTLAPDGTLYFGCYDRNLYALNSADGSLKWKFKMGDEVRASSPAIDANGVVYVGDYDGNLYAVNPDGTLKRIYATGGWVRSSPVIDGTRLYVGSNDQQLYAFDIGAAAANSPWPMYQFAATHPGRYIDFAALPHITANPQPASLSAGGTLSLSVTATGSGLSYQWRRNGVALDTSLYPSAATASLSLPYAQASDSGTYDCFVTNTAGGTVSAGASVTVAAASNAVNNAQLIAISGRSYVGTGTQVLVAGFVISGTTPKTVLVRASGPALGPQGVNTFLPDPELQLFKITNGTAQMIDQNTGWGNNTNAAAIKAEAAALHDFAWPDGSADSALLVTLQPGLYTAQVSGASGDTGTSLVEVYDGDTPSTAPRLVDISLRSKVGTGTNVQVAGFVISGTKPKTVLIRAGGPALAKQGISDYLPDPVLVLYDHNSIAIRKNQGWSTNATDAAAILAAGSRLGAYAWADGSADSALLVTLPPGLYTAQVSGASGDTGVDLLEVYDADIQ